MAAGSSSENIRVQDEPAAVTQATNATGTLSARRNMDRTPSMAIQAEKEDLKEAAQQSSTVILDLDLDGKVRWVSQSWEDVIGYVCLITAGWESMLMCP